MSKIEWKKYFRPHILERGREYYREDRVTELSDRDGNITACVEGSEPYGVEIEYSGKDIFFMSCDCPYAEGGENCKHMAAVLYAWEAGETSERPTAEELEKAINAFSKDELRRLLLSVALADDRVATILCTPKDGRESVSTFRWEKQIAAISRRYGGRDGFIDYENAWDYANELEELLTENAELLRERSSLDEAFSLICAVYEEAVTVEIDDSDGEITMLLSACEEEWAEVFEAADAAQKQKMQEWFLKEWEKADWLGEEVPGKFAFYYSSSEEMTRKALSKLERAIEEEEKTEPHSYRITGLLQQKFSVLEQLPDAETEVERFFEDYGNIPEIRMLYAERLLSAGSTNEGIRVLEQAKADTESPYHAECACKRLIELYEARNDREKLIAELRTMVMTFRQDDTNYAAQLKALLSEQEWIITREELLQSGRFTPKNELLFTEGLFRRLLDRIIQSESVSAMDRYSPFLRADYPTEVLKFYAQYLIRAAQQATNRNMYRNLMPYLRKLSEYPGGKEQAEKLATEWKLTYIRRTAMMDELKKAGF